MNRILAALALSTALAAPAFADGMAKDMACKAFTAMDSDHMMAAMHDAMGSGDAMGTGGAMASDATASTGGMASDATASTGGAMATDSAMMSPEDQMAAVVKTCTDHPDMMLMDAMHPKK